MSHIPDVPDGGVWWLRDATVYRWAGLAGAVAAVVCANAGACAGLGAFLAAFAALLGLAYARHRRRLTVSRRAWLAATARRIHRAPGTGRHRRRGGGGSGRAPGRGAAPRPEGPGRGAQ